MYQTLKRIRLISVWVFLLFSQSVFGDDPPFGSFDTPIDGSTVRGSISVTGWALDDVGVQSLKIYRDPVSGEGSGMVYIGDAVFIEGARPDIAALYPGYPNNTSAGWGYNLLTYGLPDGGNGIFTLHAIATDTDANETTLGSKTITCDNANAVKPFGEIDTPALGGTASGSNYLIQGWALTPQPNTIPIDGSTINIFVDGVDLGNPVYNQYRSVIATLFPGYNNSSGAGFYFYLNTTLYFDGTHTISAIVEDNAGNIDAIGSGYFQIYNDNPLSVFISQFTAQPDSDCIILHWITESEVDNLGFILERSDDNQSTWIHLLPLPCTGSLCHSIPQYLAIARIEA